MFFNEYHNNFKNDKLIAMQIRNLFKTSGYMAYYIPRFEEGIDLLFNETFDNKYLSGFFIRVCLPNLAFETADMFGKFGMVIPNNITVLVEIERLETKKTQLEATLNKTFPMPEEGDVLFIPFQNPVFKNIDKTVLDAPNSVQLSELLASGKDAIKFLFEITQVNNKEFIFNGKSYYYKLNCNLYQKKTSNTFTGEVGDVINPKTDATPETNPANADLYNVAETGGKTGATGENLSTGFGDLTKFD